MNRGRRRDFDWDYMDQLFPPRLSEEYGAFQQTNWEGAGRDEGDSGRHPLFKAPVKVAPDREDDVSRRLKERLGEVDKALWIFSYYPDHVYGIAGTKAAPPTPTPPTVSEPANNSSSKYSVQNGSATECQEEPIPNPKPTCLPALSAASSTAFNTSPLLEPSIQELSNGLDVRQPTAHSPSEDVNKDKCSASAQKQSSANSSSLAMHTDTKDPKADITKFSLAPKSQGLPNGLVVRQPAAHALSENANKENSSISAEKQSSADSLSLTVYTEAKEVETGSTKLSADYSSVGKHTETEDSEVDRTWFSSVPKGQGLPSGLVVRPPTDRAPFEDVSKENSSVLAQKQSSADSSSPMVHTETNDSKADRRKFSLVPKSQGLSSILVTPEPTAGAPFMKVNKENHSASAVHESCTSKSSPTVHSDRKRPEPDSTECSSMSTSSASFGQSGVSGERAALREQARKARALRVRGLGGGDPGECAPLMSPVKVLPEHPSSTTYSSLMVHKETRDAEAGSTKFSSVSKSQGLPRGLAVRPPIARAPSKDANKESISGSAQKQSSADSSSPMVHTETNDPKADRTKISLVPKSQGLPSGLVIRPHTARAPCEDVNKENSSVSAQKQLSADYSSVGKHTEPKDSEADRTWFSSVPKGQGLPSGLVIRPPTVRAPFKDVSKENCSVLAQKHSSADSSSLMVHTETNDPKADRTKISLLPKSQGLSSILVTPEPTAGAPFMNANKDNHSATTQHESYTSKSSPTVHYERKSPEPGRTECSSMTTRSASFGQSGVSGERAALREQARKARALRVRGLGGGDPGECAPLMSPVKVLPEHPSSTTYSSLMVHKETRDAEAGSTKFSSVSKSQGLPRGLAVRPPIARAPSKDANKESISGSAQHHSSTNYSSLKVHKETKSTEAGTTKFSSVPKSQGLPSGLVIRPHTARAPCEDLNKENRSFSAQKQLSADYSSVGKHTETKDSEADRTWFSSVPKGQGLPSGLVIRPPTVRAPFKDVSKENCSVLAQKHSSADSLSLMVHTETNDPKADRTKISLLPKSQGLSSILVTPEPTAGAPFMNANKDNHSATTQHESYTSKSSPTVHYERKSPEPGRTECSSMTTSSASFGQSGVSAQRAALREQARKARALRVRGLGGGDPGECPPLMSPVKVLPGQEDELARRVQDALVDVNVALWLFANHRDHLYGLAGNKVAQQTRALPPVGKPVNGRSSTSSMRNDNAMDPGGTKRSSSNRSSSLCTEQHHSNRASSSGCHVSSGGSTHSASQCGTRNQQQSFAYGPSSSHLSRHDSSRHSQNHHPRQQQLHPPQSLMDGQYKPSTAYSSSVTGSKNSRHSAQPLQGSWLQPHQSRGSSSKQDPGETRSSSSNRSSSLSTDQHYSNRVSSSGRSAHAASQPSTRNQQQSSSYNPSSSHISRHDSSHHSGNHHTKQQLPHRPQLQMGGQYKPSPTSSSSSAASKNSRHSAQPLQGSLYQPHQSRGSSSEQGMLVNATSNPKKRPLPSSSAASSAASTTNSPVPSSSQEPRNDLGVRPPAKRARRL